MAPEQFQGRASPKSDVYGLGATAIALLTGSEPEELPHEGLGIDVGRALPRGTPAPLVRALTAMLEPNPDRRVDSIDQALELLQAKPGKTSRGSKRSLRGEAQKRKLGAAESERAVKRKNANAAREARKEKQRLARERRREARQRKREQREAARARRAPLLPRLVAKLGLLVALIAVRLTVGLAVPLVLVILSLFFGGALRRAAGACMRATQRVQSRLGDASAWLSGYRADDAGAPAEALPAATSTRVRVQPELAVSHVEARGGSAADTRSDTEWSEERLALETEALVAEALEAELEAEPRRRAVTPRPSQAKRRP
jgi:hypothetical protein